MDQPIAKTAAQRVTESKARKIAAGLREIRSLWAHPDDHATIRAHAAKLSAKRERKPRTPKQENPPA